MLISLTIPGAPVAKRKMPWTRSAAERWRSSVQKSEGCWLWPGAKDRKGYARFRDDRGRKVFVHRFAYELEIGPIPDGLTLDHLCRNPGCCNPAHLEPVTIAENIRRGTQGQFQRAKTHCPQGHEYTPENTYSEPSGKRQCRECRRERVRIRDRARRQCR